MELHEDMVLCRYIGDFKTPISSEPLPHVECTKCHTRYRLSKATGRVLCNGKTYTDCPYCIADYLKECQNRERELKDQALF